MPVRARCALVATFVLGLATPREASATCQEMCSTIFVLPDCSTPSEGSRWPKDQPLSVIGWCGRSCCSPPPVVCESQCESAQPKVKIETAAGKPVAGTWKASGAKCGAYPRWELAAKLVEGTYRVTMPNIAPYTLEIVDGLVDTEPREPFGADKPCEGLPMREQPDPSSPAPPTPDAGVLRASGTSGTSGSGSGSSSSARTAPAKKGCACDASSPGLAVAGLLVVRRRRRLATLRVAG